MAEIKKAAAKDAAPKVADPIAASIDKGTQELILRAQKLNIDTVFDRVITSYSIHYTKLYDWMSLEMMREGWFAPTLNLRQPDAQCGELDYIMGEGRQLECEYLQSNNFAFGGINTSLVIRRWP